MLNPSNLKARAVTSRKTPIAASTLTYNEIDEKLGSQEFVEALKYTPSVHANRQGGGWCDSEIYMRGFDNTNIAVMINGIPMNDVENGSVYWSNWAGISDVVSLLQTQRGIGASKLSSPSVGGTINIVTKGIEAERGGSIYQMIGSDGYHKTSFTVNSGLNKHGWAFTLLGSYAAGDGYAQGTSFKSYNYFLNVSKRINDAHQLSLQFFGAPQQHYGRSNALTEVEWNNIKKYMTEGKHWTRYNPDYGFDINGKRKTADFNEYHMPQIFLNHTWQINYKSSLSTTAYVSIGRGNGYSGDGTDGYSEYDWYGSDYGVLNTKFRKIDGTFDYAAIQQLNAASTNGSKMIMTKQRGDHDWYGFVSTFESQFLNHFNYQVGLDFRYTKATHVNSIVDLFGGDYYIDYSRLDVNSQNNPLAEDESWVNAHLGIGDAVHRDYDSHIVKGGVFGQVEYAADNLSTFVAGSLNNSTYWRYDRLYYAPSLAKSDNYNYLGGTIKAGANYNINSYNNIFLNLGLITKAPQFKNGVFMSANTSNVINKDVKKSIDEFEIESQKTEFSMSSNQAFLDFSSNLNDYLSNMKKLFDLINKEIIENGENYLNNWNKKTLEKLTEFLKFTNFITENKKKLELSKNNYFDACKNTMDQENKVIKIVEKENTKNDLIKQSQEILHKFQDISLSNEKNYKNEILNMNKILEENENNYSNLFESLKKEDSNRINFIINLLSKNSQFIIDFSIVEKELIAKMDKISRDINLKRDQKTFENIFNHKIEIENNLFKRFTNEQFLDYEIFKKNNSDLIDNQNNNSTENSIILTEEEIKKLNLSKENSMDFIEIKKLQKEIDLLNKKDDANFQRIINDLINSPEAITNDELMYVINKIENNIEKSKIFLYYLLIYYQKDTFVKINCIFNLYHLSNFLLIIINNSQSGNFDLNFIMIYIAERTIFLNPENIFNKCYLCKLLSKNKIFQDII